MPKIARVINYSPSLVMSVSMRRSLVVLAALFLASCTQGGTWPNLADVPPEVRPGFEQPSSFKPEPPPPAPSSTEALAVMAKASGAAAGLGARLDQHRGRFDQLQKDLGAQADTLTATIGKGASSDNWSRTQADLSRLNADIGTLGELREDVRADAASAGGLVADLEPVGRSSLDDAAKGELEQARATVDTVLGGLGSLDREIGEALASWQSVTAAQAARLDSQPPPRSAAPKAEAPPQPARPAADKPKLKAPVAGMVTGPRDSGERFKGRQPLVTLTFEDPNLEFETKLRGLIDKVRAQYPDIAFDIETIGAPAAQLGKVRGLLQGLDIPNDVFVTPAKAGAAPSIRLYPR